MTPKHRDIKSIGVKGKMVRTWSIDIGAKQTMILSHGNAEDIEHVRDWI